MKNFYHVILTEAKNLYRNIKDSSLALTVRAASTSVRDGRVIYLLIAVAVAISFITTQVQAQSIVDLDLSATSTFGEQITFTARTRSPLQIQSAFILMQDAIQGTVYREPITFNADGASVFVFDTRQNSLRPFTTIQWMIEMTLADGSQVRSQSALIRYDDDRFNWKQQELNGLSVHWYDSGDDFGLSALNAAQAGLQKVAEFFPPDLTVPVDIFIYANESDLRGTIYGGGDAWVAGHADSAAGILTVTIEAGVEQNIQMEQRIPHELMHVLLYRHVGDGYKNIPAWLREGMAMLAEVYPDPEYDRFLRDAAARNALITMQDLCASFPPNSDSAFLAYTQSRSFTNYLRGQYGTDGLLSLAGAYANGLDCERGTEQAFGVSLSKLERDWRVDVLGENGIVSALTSFAPYLILLCLVMFFPLIGFFNAMRKKDNR